MAEQQHVLGVMPTSPVLLRFTPNIYFEEKDSFGNVISAYMPKFPDGQKCSYQVRDMPEHKDLLARVQSWAETEAWEKQSDGSKKMLGFKLVTVGG